MREEVFIFPFSREEASIGSKFPVTFPGNEEQSTCCDCPASHSKPTTFIYLFLQIKLCIYFYQIFAPSSPPSPSFPNRAGAQKTCCARSGIRVAFLFPGGSRSSATPLPSAAGSRPAAPQGGLSSARASQPAARGPACRGEESAARPRISSKSTPVSTVGRRPLPPRRAGRPAAGGSPAGGARGSFTKGSLVSWGTFGPAVGKPDGLVREWEYTNCGKEHCGKVGDVQRMCGGKDPNFGVCPGSKAKKG